MIDYLIGFGTAALVVFIILRKVLKAKKGKNDCFSCGCTCTGCPMASSCHQKKLS